MLLHQQHGPRTETEFVKLKKNIISQDLDSSAERKSLGGDMLICSCHGWVGPGGICIGKGIDVPV